MPKTPEYEAVVRQVLTPHFGDPSLAWRGFYELLLWFDSGVPHIMDGDKLRSGAWRARAEAVLTALAREFDCMPGELANRVDMLVRSPIFSRPPQRQNPLGKGFVTALFVTFEYFSSPNYEFLPEGAIGRVVFKGIQKPPRLAPDIVVAKGGSEIAVISAKWSLRHDRLQDFKEEAAFFKTVSRGLAYYVVTNEFDPARLNNVLQDYRIDGVFHVNRRMVVDVAQVDGRLDGLRDLSDLLALFTT